LFAIQAFVNNLMLTEIISAYMIGMKVDTFAALPVMSLSLAMVTLAGQNVGAGNKLLLKKYEQYGKIGGIVFGIVMSLIMLFYGRAIVTIFIGSGETKVIEYGTMYVRTLSIVYVLVTYYEVAFGVIKGRGKPYVPMILSMIGVWCVRVPLAFVLIKQYGFYGVCVAIPIAWATTFLLTIAYEGNVAYKKQKQEGKFDKQRIA
jgi:Na+-driven multidrug efflux pump